MVPAVRVTGGLRSDRQRYRGQYLAKHRNDGPRERRVATGRRLGGRWARIDRRGLPHEPPRGDIGHYRCESIEDGEATVVCENPYPCSFDQGIVEAVVDEFNPDATYIRVEETSERCRDDGGGRCRYRVSW